MKEYLLNIRNNIWFPFISLAFAVMIYRSGKLYIILALFTVAFSLICAFLCNNLIKNAFAQKSRLIVSALAALVVSAITVKLFIIRLTVSRRFFLVIQKLDMQKELVLYGCSILLGLFAFAFLTVGLTIVFRAIKRFVIDNNFKIKPKALATNFIKNILFFISCASFFILNLQMDEYGFISLVISVFLLAVFFTQIFDLKKKLLRKNKLIYVISAFSSVGICYYAYRLFRDYLNWNTLFINHINSINLNPNTVYRVASAVLALVALISVFAFCVLFFDYLYRKLSPLLSEINKAEWVVYSVIVIGFCALSLFCFTHSNAFYDTGGYTANFDLIYTSDTVEIVRSNTFLKMFASQNDLKQPLFMLCAAPFTGAFYLFSLPFSNFAKWITPFFINVSQIFILVFSFVMLAKCLRLSSKGRICFVVFCSTTYTVLLFSFMIEQYIVTFFWLILVIYLVCENKKADPVSLVGAGGTMITSVVLLPCASDKINVSTPSKAKSLIRKMEMPTLLLGFSVLTLAKCDTLFRTNYILNELSKYSASDAGIIGNLKMYSFYLVNCFMQPSASVIPSKFFGDPSWQLNEATSFNWLSLIVVAVAALGFWLTRKTVITKISGIWVIYSFVLLCIMGWGSFENGMILYSLYFGWALMVLAFQLIRKIAELTKKKYMLPTLTIIISIAMLIANAKGIFDIIQFATAYYPA